MLARSLLFFKRVTFLHTTSTLASFTLSRIFQKKLRNLFSSQTSFRRTLVGRYLFSQFKCNPAKFPTVEHERKSNYFFSLSNLFSNDYIIFVPSAGCCRSRDIEEFLRKGSMKTLGSLL